jgi:hypothetical protein
MNIGRHVKYPFLLSYFNETWILPTYFRKILKFPIKICPVGAELLHADARTDGQTWRSYPLLFAITWTCLIMHLQSQSVTEHLTVVQQQQQQQQQQRLVVTKLDCMIQWRSEQECVIYGLEKLGNLGSISSRRMGFSSSPKSPDRPREPIWLFQFVRGLCARR